MNPFVRTEGRRGHSPCKHTLRRHQVRLAGDFMEALAPENKKEIERWVKEVGEANAAAATGTRTVVPLEPKAKLARQLLMGQGKTAIITPLLCMLLADGQQLPVVMLPEALLEAGRYIVSSTFTGLVHKRVRQTLRLLHGIS